MEIRGVANKKIIFFEKSFGYGIFIKGRNVWNSGRYWISKIAFTSPPHLYKMYLGPILDS